MGNQPQPDSECLCANSPFYAWVIHGIECASYRLMYWYHPDYLGHNEFITDNRGLPYQYFHYSAFGETLVEDNAHFGQFSSPYRFNAKELDLETGNYYYGARYYNPTWSVWLGVDPLAGKYPSHSPYNFSNLNPIRFIDPNGLEGYEVDNKGYINPSPGQTADFKYYVENGNTDEIVVVMPGDEYNGNGVEVDYLSMGEGTAGVVVEKGALSSVYSINKGENNRHTWYEFGDASNAEEVYKYLADAYVNEGKGVEWGRAILSSNGSEASAAIGTSHKYDRNSVLAIFRNSYQGRILNLSHSHPGGTPPSLYGANRQPGDLSIAKRAGLNVPYSVYSNGFYYHYSQKTLNDYKIGWTNGNTYDSKNRSPWPN